MPENEQELAEEPLRGPSFEAAMSPREIQNYRAQSDVTNTNSNQSLARQLVMLLFIVLAAAFMISYIIGLFLNKGESIDSPSSMAEKILPILQSALFTLLGYLFGKKDSHE